MPKRKKKIIIMSDIGFQVSQFETYLVSKYLSGHNSPSDSTV